MWRTLPDWTLLFATADVRHRPFRPTTDGAQWVRLGRVPGQRVTERPAVVVMAACSLAVVSCVPDSVPDVGQTNDADGDGYRDEKDCEPENAAVHPDATEVCDNALDDDCSGGAPECRQTGRVSMDDADTFIDGESPGDMLGGPRALGDLNGDGFDEFSVTAGQYHEGRTWDEYRYFIVAGGPELPTTQAGAWGSIPRQRLLHLVPVGDVDGDGTADLGGERADTEENVYESVVFTEMGSGERPVEEAYVVGGYPAADSIWRLAGGSDLSGDGANDLVLGGLEASYACIGPFDSAEAGDGACTVVFEADDQGPAGEILSSADLDGDGIGDVVLSYPEWCADESGCLQGLLRVVLGPVSGTIAWEDSDASLVGDTESWGLRQPLNVGDVDGDGLDEVSARSEAWSAHAAYFFGVEDLAEGEIESVGTVFRGSEAPILTSYWTPADFDGDGVADLAYPGTATDPMMAESDHPDAVFVAYGPIGLGLAPDLEVESSTAMEAYGAVGAGDVDGDGHDDLMLSDSGYGCPYGCPSGSAEYTAYGTVAAFFGHGL